MASGLVQPYANAGANGGVINPFLPTQQASFRFWAGPVYTAADGTLWCPGFDGPVFSANPWDFVTVAIPYGPNIGGASPDRTPGIARVGVKHEYAVDKKKPIGNNGARLTVHGLDIAEVDIEIKVWTPEQLRQLELMWATLFPPANKGTPIAFDVGHPEINDVHNVKSVQFITGSGPEIQGDRTGIFRIKAWEWNPPSKTTATKTQTKSVSNRLDPTTTPTPGSNPANLAPR